MKSYLKKISLLLLLFIFSVQAKAQFEGLRISPDAKISLITCSSGNDLYAVFGHSAVRVQDPSLGMDVIFNYGTFDFNEPNFYLKFAQGKLNYKLSAAHFQDFVYSYAQDNRSVFEQELNLTPEQKQKYWLFLTNNYLPANRFYLYDFFFDNCATRIRDGLEATFPDQIKYNIEHLDKDYSFRNLIDLYLPPQPWGDFGIDLALGARIDREATPYEYMFLPDYLSEGFANATIQQNGQAVLLTGKPVAVFTQEPAEQLFSLFTPIILCWFLFIAAAAVTLLDLKKSRRSRTFDFILFFAAGLLGIVMLLLWFATDHQATANNFNLLWAIPTHVVVAFLLGKQVLPEWVRKYMAITGLITGILTISWWILPQEPHAAFIPLGLTLLLRAEYIAWFEKKKELVTAKV
ncbi:Lnb N-terminal periplasmic domain-containing protein [Pontibacter sp. H249]|uniref:Lnb N-terminal periplasmic domain-containing protein n=1 Tax=Pontibacter sp. H249 TaxID=3133420 RepID=UPI0030BB8F0F